MFWISCILLIECVWMSAILSIIKTGRYRIRHTIGTYKLLSKFDYVFYVFVNSTCTYYTISYMISLIVGYADTVEYDWVKCYAAYKIRGLISQYMIELDRIYKTYGITQHVLETTIKNLIKVQIRRAELDKMCAPLYDQTLPIIDTSPIGPPPSYTESILKFD